MEDYRGYAVGGLVSLEDIKIMKAKLSDNENDVYAEIIQKRIDDAMKKEMMEIIDGFTDVDMSYATTSNSSSFSVIDLDELVKKVEKCNRDNMSGEYLGLLRNYGVYRLLED